MPSYAFAIGSVRMYLRIGPKTRTNRRFSKTRPDAWTKAKKEDVSDKTRTYGNPRKCSPTSAVILLWTAVSEISTNSHRSSRVQYTSSDMETLPFSKIGIIRRKNHFWLAEPVSRSSCLRTDGGLTFPSAPCVVFCLPHSNKYVNLYRFAFWHLHDLSSTSWRMENILSLCDTWQKVLPLRNFTNYFRNLLLHVHIASYVRVMHYASVHFWWHHRVVISSPLLEQIATVVSI